jgi:drug/metabolite transporter (DMT)-like permease
VTAFLWIAATLIAAAAQTARNATQRGLTERIGVMGATQVRFLYGLPFAMVFLALAAVMAGRAPPVPSMSSLGWALGGAISQIAATALMLTAMTSRSFAVTTAWTKTEPIQTAIVAAMVIGDPLSPPKLAAIGLATLGVALMSPPRKDAGGPGHTPLLMGLAAGGLFGLAAVCFRGAIQSLPEAESWLRAATILVLGLALQSALLIVWLALRDRPALSGSVRAWKPSLVAGFLGAFASLFWFIGFALTAVANVRTLALVEVFMARAVSRRWLAEATSWRETLGMVLLVLGVAGVLLMAF